MSMTTELVKQGYGVLNSNLGEGVVERLTHSLAAYETSQMVNTSGGETKITVISSQQQ